MSFKNKEEFMAWDHPSITRCNKCNNLQKRSLFRMYDYCPVNDYKWEPPLGELIGCNRGSDKL